ncbi:hypothetical protein [Kosakonia sp. YIM B13611]|uniref:hypothetical protein n=1 Tax=unclassified Kosakonia TaxID=2632876 RepID=UPI0036BB2347
MLRKTAWGLAAALLLAGLFSFGYLTYYPFLHFFWGSTDLIATSVSATMLATLINGLLFAFSGLLMLALMLRQNARQRFSAQRIVARSLGIALGNVALFSLFVAGHKFLLAPQIPQGVSVDITHDYLLPEWVLSTVIVLMLSAWRHKARPA